jgi:hypothetical protein
MILKKWMPVLGKDHAGTNNLKRDDDSKGNHLALRGTAWAREWRGRDCEGRPGREGLSVRCLYLFREHFQEISCKLPIFGGQLAQITKQGVVDLRHGLLVHTTQQVVGGDLKRVGEATQRVEGGSARPDLEMSDGAWMDAGAESQFVLAPAAELSGPLQSFLENIRSRTVVSSLFFCHTHNAILRLRCAKAIITFLACRAKGPDRQKSTSGETVFPQGA